MADDDTHKAQIEEARALFKSLHWPYWLMAQGQRLQGSTGLPDMFAIGQGNLKVGEFPDCRTPVPFWFECKVGKDKLSDDQRAFRLLVNPHIPVIVGRVADIIDFFKL